MKRAPLKARLQFLLRGNFQSPSDWVKEYFYGGSKDDESGVAVNERSAMQVIAVYSCVRVLAESFASLPAVLYRRTARGKVRATDHPVYKLLHEQPNPEMSPFQFKELLMGHDALYGNAYAQIMYDNNGYPAELWPLMPHRMKVERKSGKLRYTYHLDDQKNVPIPAANVLHVPALSYDGVSGYAPIDLARRGVGLTIASEAYGARFFGNDARPGGIIQLATSAGADAKKRLAADWNEFHRSMENKHRVAVLEQGAEWKEIGIPPEQAQFLETRKFQINEIARLFRVPPHMIGDLERATFSNIEHQALEFVQYTLQPWLVRWEEALSLQLLSERDREEYFVEFLVDALLRGDVQSRAAAYRTFREIGVMTANEIRSRENMDDVPNGDELYVPLNWIPMSQASEPVDQVEPPQQQRSEQRAAVRSANTRHRIATRYQRMIAEGVGRIIRAEAKDMRRAAKSNLRSRASFEEWVAEYYGKLPERIRREMMPYYAGMMEAVREEIADELSVDGNVTDANRAFVEEYIGAYIGRHIGKSEKDITKALDEALASEVDFDTRIDELAATWEQERPSDEARREAVRGSNAFAKAVYLSVGVTTLRWIALGAETCELCQSLNGAVVEIQRDFAMPGETIANGGNDISVSRHIGHPPLHDGCVCQIAAG